MSTTALCILFVLTGMSVGTCLGFIVAGAIHNTENDE